MQQWYMNIEINALSDGQQTIVGKACRVYIYTPVK